MIIDLQPEEFLEKKRSPGVIIAVHDLQNEPDIHTEGKQLIPGLSYAIPVSKVITQFSFLHFFIFFSLSIQTSVSFLHLIEFSVQRSRLFYCFLFHTKRIAQTTPLFHGRQCIVTG